MLALLATLALTFAPQEAEPMWELRKRLRELDQQDLRIPESDLARLSELLRSEGSTDRAAGAYLAGKLHRGECVPALLEALAWENERPRDAETPF